MTVNQPQKTSPGEMIKELYSSFDDNEFYEAMEIMEAHNKGRISDDEFSKLVYINKTRELLKGGDA